jgi:hypothetical protein
MLPASDFEDSDHRVKDFKCMMKNVMKRTHRKGPEMQRAVVKLGPNPKSHREWNSINGNFSERKFPIRRTLGVFSSDDLGGKGTQDEELKSRNPSTRN